MLSIRGAFSKSSVCNRDNGEDDDLAFGQAGVSQNFPFNSEEEKSEVKKASYLNILSFISLRIRSRDSQTRKAE